MVAAAQDANGDASQDEVLDDYGFEENAFESDAEFSNADIDPFESFNRSMLTFNDYADQYLLMPIVKGYQFIAPSPVEKGVDNFFNNLEHLPNTVNALFQLKLGDAGIYATSFLANTTLGVFGLFDAASGLGLPRLNGEDFGQTLGYYGVPSGPYLMLPLFGPSTLRDAPARLVDGNYEYREFVRPIRVRNSLYFLEGVNTRVQIMDAEAFITGDRYTFIRGAYLQQREFLINDGVIDDEAFDDFGGDWNDGGYDEFDDEY